MIDMLSNPAMAQQFNEALQNPAVIDLLIQQSPQLREMGPAARQMLQSEEFRRMMTDPERLRAMHRLQGMMGMGTPGGAQGGFPMPGVTDTTPVENRGAEGASTTNTAGAPPTTTGTAAAANPFAQLFGLPPGANQPPAGGANPADPAQNPLAGLFMGANPFAAANPGDGSAAANPMQNPELLAQALRAMGGGANAGGEGLSPFANLFGGANPYAAPADNRPPAERYATQLRQLNEMGFFDYDRNIQALQRSGGDVNGALEYLFSQT